MSAKDITATDARQNLTHLLSRVQYQNKRFRLLSHGRAVAGLVTLADLEKLEALDREKKSQS